MTVANNYVPVKTLGNGVTTDFTGIWNAISEDYLLVYLENVATGEQTLQVIDDDYTASVADDGFTVTFAVAPSSSYYVVIGRDVDASQQNPYKTSRGYQGDVLETSLDKLSCIAQQNKEIVERAIVSPLGSAGIKLPSATVRANKYLAFDESGNPTASSGTTDTPISDAMETVVSAASLAAARAAMGVVGEIKTKVFTSSGTYTPTSGMLYADVIAVGGGGGGGGCSTTTSTEASAAGGGGGGASVRKIFTAAQIGASQTVTIGSGGTGGVGSGAIGQGNGTSGGNTTFGSLLTANGGSYGTGGTSSSSSTGSPGGDGGAGSGGDLNTNGQTGSWGLVAVGGGGYMAISGAGGNTLYGHGGASTAGYDGDNGKGYGGGGGGAANYASRPARTGGSGASGLVYIVEYCN